MSVIKLLCQTKKQGILHILVPLLINRGYKPLQQMIGGNLGYFSKSYKMKFVKQFIGCVCKHPTNPHQYPHQNLEHR